jgi:hypothetical protein
LMARLLPCKRACVSSSTASSRFTREHACDPVTLPCLRLYLSYESRQRKKVDSLHALIPFPLNHFSSWPPGEAL